MKCQLIRLSNLVATFLLVVGSHAVAQSNNDSIRLSVSTVLDGKSVESSCVIKNNKDKWEIKQTPAEVDVTIDDSPLVVTCAKRGSKDGSLVLLKPHNPESASSTGSVIGASAFGLIGGLIGGAIDSQSTPTTLVSSPSNLVVQLGKTVISGDLVPESLKSQGEYEFDYGVMESSDGLKISLTFSKYQFIPDKDSVKQVCISQIKKIAENYANEHNKRISSITDSQLKVSTRRNGGLGMTYCQSTLSIPFTEQPVPQSSLKSSAAK